ncbi:cyclodehydratase [Hoyosella sp. G463]|uniref:Cyclodehydratase n=1 Tax=Lolliginicoccus lacisalsi TaxID=2742202 RepID=A0A927JE25_9ACTN|nr:cyclodehydratase [Lolliginicoccus lacisalsi]MBD8506667.1 cyclodehydratase [Lolliginicoccus lacisalsi]
MTAIHPLPSATTSRADSPLGTHAPSAGTQWYPAIDPSRPVLVRPGPMVQVGWNPDTAASIAIPASVPAEVVARLLRLADGSRSQDQLLARAHKAGVPGDLLLDALAALAELGIVVGHTQRPGDLPPIRIVVIGHGPLSAALGKALPRLGIRVRLHPGLDRVQHLIEEEDTALVILADQPLFPPHLTDMLALAGRPHLLVRTRAQQALIGPLVLPGISSCSRCADLFRTDKDPAWPYVAAQLASTTATASQATIHTTVGYTLAQIEAMVRAWRDATDGQATSWPELDVLGSTVEIDPRDGTITLRQWPRHPLCRCWDAAACG